MLWHSAIRVAVSQSCEDTQDTTLRGQLILQSLPESEKDDLEARAPVQCPRKKKETKKISSTIKSWIVPLGILTNMLAVTNPK